MLVPKATRIIIDMQACFEAACRYEVVLGVVKEITVAMKQRAPILIVEYKFPSSGKTHKGLMEIIDDYPHMTLVRKTEDSGAEAIKQAIVKKKIPHRYFRVCGVNADCCVQATINDLLDESIFKKTKIEIIKNACGTSSRNHRWGLYPKHPNLRII
jgi:nicotinamidase-related amidase